MEQRITPSHAPKTLVHNPNHPMENLQNLVLKLAQAHPNAPLPPPAETLLRDRLDRFVSDYRTPEHPPYSAVIVISMCVVFAVLSLFLKLCMRGSFFIRLQCAPYILHCFLLNILHIMPLFDSGSCIKILPYVFEMELENFCI